MKRNTWGGQYKSNLEVGMTAAPQNGTGGMPQMPNLADVLPNQPEVIEVVENKIYFYADIDRQNILKLNKTIDTLNIDLYHKSLITKNSPAEIYLSINSMGGHIFDAFSAVDTVLDSMIPVNTIIDGCCASAGTFISVVGKKRYIKKHSYFLIHQLSSAMWGKYSEFKDEIENLDKFMSMIKKIYKQHTKLPMSKLDEILKHDLFFDAEEALEYGIVDEIIVGRK